MDKKILVFLGAGQLVKNYGGYDGVEIWLPTKTTTNIADADYAIGHSLGASFALANINNQKTKFILVNPLILKRSLINNLFRWLRFRIFEGISLEKIAPARCWPYVFREVYNFLKIDVLENLSRMPKENVTIIRGNRDDFFCDEEAVKILDGKFNLIEADAGHDWNENIARLVKKLIEEK